MANLLIVEDDPALQEAIGELLSLDGHSVQKADNAEAALAMLENQIPDLIVTDLLMPGMSGLQLAGRVRAHPDWKDIPIIFISASTTLEHEGRISEMERVIFLRKPFSAEALREAVAQSLEAD